MRSQCAGPNDGILSSRDTNSPPGVLMSCLSTGSLGSSYGLKFAIIIEMLSHFSLLHSLQQPWQLVQIDRTWTVQEANNQLFCWLQSHAF